MHTLYIWTVPYGSVLPVTPPFAFHNPVSSVIAMPEVRSKRESVWVCIPRSIHVAGRVVRSKLSQGIPVLAFAILFVSCSIVTI